MSTRHPAGRAALGVGTATAAVSTLVLAEWRLAPVRDAMASLAEDVTWVLYALAAVALAGSIIRRRRPPGSAGGTGRGARTARTARYRVLRAPAAATGCVVTFLVPVFGAWARGTRPPATAVGLTLAGVVPYGDGTLWWGGAQRLLFHGFVDDYGAKRPLNPALLAVRLALTRLDLRLATVLQAVLVGMAVFLLARVVARHLGVAPALAVVAGIAGFAAYPTVSTYTEPLGVTFGALAAAALWSALAERNVPLFLAGTALLSVAWNVRPGAFAVLLLVPLWFARFSRREGDGWVAWPVLGLGVAAVAVGVAVGVAASLVTGGNPWNTNGNSAYMVYGLAAGEPGWTATGGGWGQVFFDHPEILPLDDYGRSVAVRRLALREIRRHPGRFARSVLQSEANYLRQATSLAVPIPDRPVRRAVQAGAVVVGALALLRRRRERLRDVLADVGLFGASILALPALLVWGVLSGLPAWLGGALALVAFLAFVVVGGAYRAGPAHGSFLLVVAAGVASSLPFIGVDTARVLAATVPLLALPLALAVRLLGQAAVPGDRVDPGLSVGGVRERWAPVVAAAALVAIALVGAPVAAAAIDQPRREPRACPDGGPAQALFGAQSVRVVERDQRHAAPDVLDAESAARDLQEVVAVDLVKHLIRPGTTIVAGLDERGDDRIVFLSGSVRASATSVLYFCGAPLGDDLSAVLNYFWPRPVDFAFMSGTPLDP